jgi:aryl-alcohol dehydrogenase-like predicted oxidoreductase
MGVIAKRPIANAVLAASRRPSRGSYGYEYWRRLQELDYDFMQRRDAVATALRFTLSVPGVHTAIVGTARPGRFEENARYLDAGPLSAAELEAIRARWSAVAPPSWVGQT